MKSAKVIREGMKAAVKAIAPAAAREPSSTGFLPSESAARPQNGAVSIIPEKFEYLYITYFVGCYIWLVFFYFVSIGLFQILSN